MNQIQWPCLAPAVISARAASHVLACARTNRSRLPAICSALVPGQSLAFGVREVLELLLGHRSLHLLRCAFELGFRRFSALGGERGAGGFLLGFGLGGHDGSPYWRGVA